MDLILVTKGIEFQACGPFTKRLDKEGNQRRDGVSKLPLWAVELVVWDNRSETNPRTETILVTVGMENPPSLNQMDWVVVEGLRAIPWVSDNGSRAVRIAYRAEAVLPVEQVMKKAS